MKRRLWDQRYALRHALPGLPRPRRAALEEVGPGYQIRGWRRRDAGAVFQYSLAGCGRFRLGAREWRVPPGTGFLHRVRASGLSYGHDGGEVPWRFVFLAFTGADAVVDALVERHGPVLALADDHPAVRHLLWLGERGGGEVLDPGEGALLVTRLLAALADRHLPDADRSGARLVRRARRVVAEHLADGVDVAGLAAALGCSREHLSRSFARELGVSPRDWIAEERIRRARERLRDPGDRTTIAGLAAELGFASASRFDKVFKRVTGTTPSAYRARPLR